MSVQRTIANETSLTGIGLHSGESCTMRIRPAPPDSGMVFMRGDLPGKPSIRAHPDRLCQRMRRTAMADGAVEVHTTEHFLSAAHGLGIDNLHIELSAVELPGMDGSAAEFAKALSDAGIVEQGAARVSYDLDQPIAITTASAQIVALPYKNGLKITYTLDDHGGAMAGTQMVELELLGDHYLREIAPARTFVMKHEVEMLRAAGLGKGATYQNTCVYDGERLIDNTLRFANEAARHKVLDLIGDLAMTTRRVNAHIIAVRSGHKENMALVQELNRRIEKAARPPYVLDLPGILKVLPHRFPFLLIDRVLELEPGKRIVAIKNVSINEPYFQGHFPTMPTMPGVLQIEAIAQAGAVTLLALPDRTGKVPLFMSMDKVKFRRPVVPGDQMRVEVECLRLRERMAACKGTVTVDGQLCAEAEIRSMLIDREASLGI